MLASDPVFTTNSNTSITGDVGLFDNDSDAEEDHVYLPEELGLEAESEVEEESTDDGPIIPQRGRSRRYCLEGCDCERLRGRLCECEKRDDGMCNDQCQCDPSKCRASAHDEDEVPSGESDEEED